MMSDSPAPATSNVPPPFTPPAGQVVFSRTGHEGAYVTRLPDGQHLVRPAYEACSPDPEVGSYTDYQGLAVWDEVYQGPPVAKLNAEVAALNVQITDLRKAVQVVIAERATLDRQMQERKDRIRQHEQLAQLDDYLAGKITHFVVLDRSYSNDTLYGISIQTLKEALEDEERPWNRRGCRFKLMSLFGDSDGDLSWHINAYRDGSGQWTEVIPCTSMEQAQAKAREIYEGELAAWRAAPGQPTNQKPSRHIWTPHALIKHAQKLGLPVPEDAVAADEADKLADAEECVEKARNALAKAEADLFARQMGQAIDGPCVPRPPAGA